jgi:hypothetical protein
MTPFHLQNELIWLRTGMYFLMNAKEFYKMLSKHIIHQDLGILHSAQNGECHIDLLKFHTLPATYIHTKIILPKRHLLISVNVMHVKTLLNSSTHSNVKYFSCGSHKGGKRLHSSYCILEHSKYCPHLNAWHLPTLCTLWNDVFWNSRSGLIRILSNPVSHIKTYLCTIIPKTVLHQGNMNSTTLQR